MYNIYDLNIFLGDKLPRIDASRIPRSVTVKAGRPLELEIPFEAFPVPIMYWDKDGKAIPTGPDALCRTSVDAKRAKLNM